MPFSSTTVPMNSHDAAQYIVYPVNSPEATQYIVSGPDKLADPDIARTY
jgi:hypothetical protein